MEKWWMDGLSQMEILSKSAGTKNISRCAPAAITVKLINRASVAIVEIQRKNMKNK